MRHYILISAEAFIALVRESWRIRNLWRARETTNSKQIAIANTLFWYFQP